MAKNQQAIDKIKKLCYNKESLNNNLFMNLYFNEKSINLAKKLIIFQLLLVMSIVYFVPVTVVNAGTPLVISNIEIVKTDKTATISWRTNRDAYATVHYGLYSKDYHWKVNTNNKDTVQAITITGLFPDTDYFISIVADDETSEVTSFEQVITTKDSSDNKSPEISDVRVQYLTGETATIQWYTNEKATTEVEYGKTDSYGKTAKSSKLTKIHDITLKNLTVGAIYHFRVKSKDKDNNTTRWQDMDFRTIYTNLPDKDKLIIYSITPSSENNLNVSENTTVISWRTNKLASGFVRYGTTLKYGKTAYSNPPRDFTQSITLTDLKPGTVYYFEINSHDVLGKKVKTGGHSFITKSNGVVTTYNPTPSSQVLGVSTMSVDLRTDFGFYGMYYNLTKNMPGMELYKGTDIPNNKVGRENYWYNDEYFAFDRVDQNLDFGKKFFPVDEGKSGDPYHFAINWRAIVNVPVDDYYEYEVACDDDCWILVDDNLVVDLGGVHPARNQKKAVYLTEGYHKLEIYYAERSRKGSVFTFIPDSRLKFHPLPDGYDIDDVLEYNQWLYGQGPTPIVLGVSNIPEPAPAPAYACNPDLGYTKFKALYKTNASPDIWAILENGQKHYISSPEAFAKYQCGWGEVQIVSQATLNSYPNAELVRTPDDPTIYHLFQRPERKWLKVNIPSPTVFVSYPKNYWGNVAWIDALDVQAYPDARLAKVKGDSDVYLLENGEKRFISSEIVFINNGYDWAEVVELSQIHIDSYKDGQSVD